MSLAETVESLKVGELRENAPLAPWTSVRVGGPADVWVKPRTAQSLVDLLRLVRDDHTPLHVLGGGANTLVADAGVRGVVLKLPSDLFPEQLERKGDTLHLTLGAGAAISRLIVQMKAHRVVGAEFLAGIPGTLGGAVAMNAGTKNGECMTVVQAVEFATADGLGFLPSSAFTSGYRHTELPPHSVVTRIHFVLREGDVQASAQAMEKDLAYRKATQPLSQPNFGSVFTNPPGHHAGRLIEEVGLKGHRVGNAQISTLHANWIVNLGGALARDILTLMELAQKRVHDATGISLVPEVKKVGAF